MQYIIAIGIFQAMMIMTLLWRNRLRSSADDLLILLVACIASHLAIKFVIFNFIADQQVRNQMNTFTGLCYGPLLYLYALKVSQEKTFIPASKWYVFLPFIFGAIAYFTVAGVLYFSTNSDYRLLYWYNNVSTVAIVGTELCFTYLAVKVSRRHLAAEKHLERKMIQRIAICFCLISALTLPFFVRFSVTDFIHPLFIRSVVYAVLTYLCVWIGYHKLLFNTQTRVSYLFNEVSVENVGNLGNVEKQEAGKFPALQRKSPLSEARQKEIWEILESQVKDHKIFADSELNLDKLSIATGINKYHLSETLNTYAQKSFYQYINEYRIAYALSQMQILHRKEIPVNVLSLAYDAGFRAKSSFNRYFKEITGFTPTEHLKSLQ